MNHTGQPVPNEDGTYKKDICLNCYMPKDEQHFVLAENLCEYANPGEHVCIYRSCSRHCQKVEEEHDSCEKELLPRDWVKKEFKNHDEIFVNELVIVILDYLDHIIPDLQRQIKEAKKEARDAMRNAINN